MATANLETAALLTAEVQPRSRQAGSASIEFVLLFPAMFLILYALITYGLVFGAQQTLTLAAAEGGRAAMRYQNGATTPTDAFNLRAVAAEAAANQSLSWLSSLHPDAVSVDVSKPPVCDGAPALTCLVVQVNYDYKKSPLIPPLLGPLLSFPVPEVLRSQAAVQLSPMQLL